MLIPQAYAQCPVCVLSVGGGLLIAQKLGVDDLIGALWISGLTTAFAFWFASFIKKPAFLRSPLLWTVIMFISTWIYFSISNQMYINGNTFLGVDKVLVGLVFGVSAWLTGIGLDKLIRYRNGGKVLFLYQKVIIPLVVLLITTGIFSILITIFYR